MDFLLIHEIYTVVLLGLFVGIVGWTWSGNRQTSFCEASRIPFLGDPTEDPTEGALTAPVRGEDSHE